MRNHIRQPNAVVGKMRAYAAAGRRMPPVLYITFEELTRRRAQNMFTGKLRRHQRDRHTVLQLIAKTVGPACLIERGTGPIAAR